MLKKEIKLLLALILFFTVDSAYSEANNRIRIIGEKGEKGEKRIEFVAADGKTILKTINLVNKVEIFEITKNNYKAKGLPQEFIKQFGYEFKAEPSKIIFMRKQEVYEPTVSTIYSPTRDSIKSQFIYVLRSMWLNTGKVLSEDNKFTNIVDIYDVNGKKLYTLKDIGKYVFSNTNKYFIYSPFSDSKKARILNIKDNKEYEIDYLGGTIFSRNDLYLLFVNYNSKLLSIYDLENNEWALKDHNYKHPGYIMGFEAYMINENNRTLELPLEYFKSKSDSINNNPAVAKIDTIRF